MIKKQTCILVLGMHRSGTSALTGFLNILGLNAGKKLMPASKDNNEKGFFENKKITDLNETKLLPLLNMRWDSFLILGKNWHLNRNLEELYKEARQIILDDYKNDILFLIKDPRICFLFPFWEKVLCDLGIDIKVILPFRNPIEVSESLAKRNNFEINKSLILWTKYILYAEYYSRNYDRMFTRFDDLMNDTKNFCKNMSEFLGIDLMKQFYNKKSEIDKFLDFNLKHYTKPIDLDSISIDLVKSSVKLFLEQLREDKIEYRNKSDSLINEYNALIGNISEVNKYFLDEFKNTYSIIEEKNNKLEELNVQKNVRITELKDVVQNRDQKLEGLQQRAIKRDQTIEDSQKRVQELKDTVLKRDQAIEDSQKRVQELKDTVLKRDQAIEDSQKRVQELKKIISKRDNEIIILKKKMLQEAKEMQEQSNILNKKLNNIYSSRAWKYVMKYYKIKNFILSKNINYRDNLNKTDNKKNNINTSTKKEIFDVPMENYILVSCWMSGYESTHDFLKNLIYSLDIKGIKTLYLTSSIEVHKKKTINTLFSSFMLSRQNYGEVDSTNKSIPEWMKEIIVLEKAWARNLSSKMIIDDTIEFKAQQAYYYWYNLYIKYPPSFSLIWGSTSPFSRLLIKLSQILNIPYQILERGHFPKTLFVDTYGQLGFSDINRQPQSALLKEFKSSYIKYNDILEWDKNNSEVAYQAFNTKSNVVSLVDKRFNNGKKHQVILFIGSNDLGSGSLYKKEETNETHCPLFNSSSEAFKYVRNIVESLYPEALLIVKLHPSEKTSNLTEIESKNIIYAKDYSINELIINSDICISLSTTAYAKCIVEKKPIVTLGITDLHFKNIVYSCNNYTDIPVMIRAAINKEEFDKKEKNGLNYIQYLFSEKLIGYDSSVPTKLYLDDFSMYLYKYIKSYSKYNKSSFSELNEYLESIYKEKYFNLYIKNTMISKEIYKNNFLSTTLVVIIPVYGDVNVTIECIESVIRSRDKLFYDILIVNDKSPIDDMDEQLNNYSKVDGLTILKNKNNLGFPSTVNRGVRYSKDSDVIILNSDTIVPFGWADRLNKQAYSKSNIATVTPMSNNASIFSFPKSPQGSELSSDMTIDEIDKIFNEENSEINVEVPVGHGFCLYIKRSCIDSIGYFDEILFGRGYSEEVDYCLRARENGLINIAATDVFVGHVGGVSFSEDSNSEKLAKRKIIKKKYPLYFKEINKFIFNDPLKQYREKAISRLKKGV